MKRIDHFRIQKKRLSLVLFLSFLICMTRVEAQFVTYQDTAFMLSNYMRTADTTSMLRGYVRVQNTGWPIMQRGKIYVNDTIKTNGTFVGAKLYLYGNHSNASLISINGSSGPGGYFQSVAGRGINVINNSSDYGLPTVYMQNTGAGNILIASNQTGEVLTLNARGALKSKSFRSDTLSSISSSGGGLYTSTGIKVIGWGSGGANEVSFTGFAGYSKNNAASYTTRSFTDKNYVDSSLAFRLKVSDTVKLLSGYLKLQNTGTAQLQTGKVYVSDTIQTNGIFYGTRMGLTGNGIGTSLSVVNTSSANAAYFQAATGRALFAINGSSTATNPTMFLKNFGTGGIISASNGTTEVMSLANNGALMAKSFITDTIKTISTTGGGLYSSAGKKLMSWGEITPDWTVFYGLTGYHTNTASAYSPRSFTDKNYVDSSVALSVKVGDLAALLNPYLQKADTTQMLLGYAKLSHIDGKLNKADTAQMLSGYAKQVHIDGKLNKTDTAQMLSGYAKQVHIDAKLNKADTAVMLQNYVRSNALSSFASVSQLHNYLPLAGGILSGTIYGTEGRFSGNLHVKKLVVAPNSWSDFVFNKDYKLRSLTEVEKYIQLNHHLPDVPSAKEVADKGISVGENQAVLLRKIEELTLYMIEQQKRIQALEKQLRTRTKK